MKRILGLASLTALIGLIVYSATFFLETLPSQQAVRGPDAGLRWLRRELRLSDRQTAAIARLQEDYRPSCQAMCRQILASDAKLQGLLGKNLSITPEILAAMAERDRLRSDCRRAFLQHVDAVSSELSSQQRRRYLALVSDELLGLDAKP